MFVLIEKPFVAGKLHAILSARFPGESFQYLLVQPFGWPFVFDYPANLAWQDYPFWSPAQYKLNPSTQWQVFLESGTPVRKFGDYAGLKPQRVLAFPDSSRSSVLAAERLVSHLQALGKVEVLEGYCPLVSLDGLLVQRAIDKPMSDARVAAACAEGQLKANFEFSFLVNASGILTRSYHAVGGQVANPVFSKYTVQALYALRAAGSLKEGMFIHSKLYMWSGTGRYAPHTTTLGSMASRGVFVGTLLELGLAAREQEQLSITPLGRAFLDQLHPDCEDPDLPFRIEEWMRDPVAGELKAQRYIRTWFGKQKRFSAS